MPFSLSLSRLVPRRQQRQRNALAAQPAQPLSSLFLQLPTDVVSYLCLEHLQPSSAVALSLACKSLFALIFPTAKFTLTRPERLELQLLLERDPASNSWYCDTCCFLHPILSKGPTRGARPRESCPDQRALLLSGSGFALTYQAVRLAMNRHFLGAPHGLPLDNFNLRLTAAGQLRWKEEWSARIIRDELFLSCRRTLSAPPWQDESLRYAMNLADPAYQLCTHFTTSAWALSAPNALTRGSPRPGQIFVPCRDYVESCRQCLSDFVTTVEQRARTRWFIGREKYWFFAVTSYHSLGSGQSPSDEKWKALVGKWSSTYNPWRDMDVYPRASVQEMWHEADAAYWVGGGQEADG
ncbi:hypothetical protein C8A05DRAFT_18158 [Staphylotrichum tortipilum]|uniref:F-box domain-containing protein n=1 Tax=Staphylotrichum tortipilum TaxID=2831512 RepID=A0AAN6MEN2_9PEZI|nr:hypothetical protein C8A05DRAFT_18158 [Staphylotrichum longicolle]